MRNLFFFFCLLLLNCTKIDAIERVFPKNIDFNQFQWGWGSPFDENAWRTGYAAFNYAPELAPYFALLKQDYQVNTVVETGTFLGSSTALFSLLFDKVHTIEIVESTHNDTNTKFQKYQLFNVKSHLGSSEKVLKNLLPSLKDERVIFYLDAHWESHWPLLEELDEISKTHRDNCIIVIDDFKVPNRAEIPFDRYEAHECSYEYIKDRLDKVYSGYTYHYLIPKNVASRAKFVAIPTKWQSAVTSPSDLHSSNENSKMDVIAESYIKDKPMANKLETVLNKKSEKEFVEHVTIAILAKDKAHTLPLYLSSLEKQTWPSHKTYLYIRTNNNNDDTAKILREWVKKVGDAYAGVFFDDTDVKEQVQNYKQHEWNTERFKVLGKIRQDSVEFARNHRSHYFVIDCDNFIYPETLEKLMETNLPIVAPLLKLRDQDFYSNYHAAVDQNGYLAHTPYYHDILDGRVKGLIEVPVVHCTYLIRHDQLDEMSYDDNSCRYEYVIFSDNARKKQIPQYLDNRELYGRITFAETKEELEKEPWLYEFQS